MKATTLYKDGRFLVTDRQARSPMRTYQIARIEKITLDADGAASGTQPLDVD